MEAEAMGYIIGLIIAVVFGLLVAENAKSYDVNGALWGFLAFLLPIVFIPMYFLVRGERLSEPKVYAQEQNAYQQRTQKKEVNQVIKNKILTDTGDLKCPSCGNIILNANVDRSQPLVPCSVCDTKFVNVIYNK